MSRDLKRNGITEAEIASLNTTGTFLSSGTGSDELVIPSHPLS